MNKEGKKRLKYIVDIQKGKVPREMTLRNMGKFPIYLAMDYLRREHKQISYVPDFKKYVLVDENEILLLWDGSNAGEFMWSRPGVLSSTMAVIKPKLSIKKSFLFYQFKLLERYLKDITVGMGIPHVNPQEFLNFSFFIPSFQSQTTISNYLDCKTAEIDQLIAQKEKLLSLYEEEKTAVINQAVTKGINPDVKLKDSGVAWLGEIPEHWEVRKLKYVVSINDESLPETTNDDYEIEYVDISNVKSGLGVLAAEPYSFSKAPSRARRIVQDGDIIVSTVRTYLKSIAKINNPPNNLIVSTGFAVVRPVQIISGFLGFLFYSELLIGEIISLSSGVSYPAINASEIGDIFVPIPKSGEQTAIIEYIETETARIESKITKTKKIIALQKEYRTALISEVVTGKIKVTREVNHE